MPGSCLHAHLQRLVGLKTNIPKCNTPQLSIVWQAFIQASKNDSITKVPFCTQKCAQHSFCKDCSGSSKLLSPPPHAVVTAHVISLKITTHYFLSNLSQHFHLVAFQERWQQPLNSTRNTNCPVWQNGSISIKASNFTDFTGPKLCSGKRNKTVNTLNGQLTGFDFLLVLLNQIILLT